MLLLDLDLDDIAWVLYDFRNERLVSPPQFARNALCQICKSAQHPVLPEDANSVAEGLKVGLDHTERPVNGPEDEENNEQVVRVPKTLKVGSSRLLHGR
jgi:hypothetical protein